MGCDGGTIPRRDELVRTKKKPEQVRSQLFINKLNSFRFDFRNFLSVSPGYLPKPNLNEINDTCIRR